MYSSSNVGMLLGVDSGCIYGTVIVIIISHVISTVIVFIYPVFGNSGLLRVCI